MRRHGTIRVTVDGDDEAGDESSSAVEEVGRDETSEDRRQAAKAELQALAIPAVRPRLVSRR
jgi:hypothetical protein